MLKALVGFGIPIGTPTSLIEDYAHYRRGEAATVTNRSQLLHVITSRRLQNRVER
jgi:hypothetical protein